MIGKEVLVAGLRRSGRRSYRKESCVSIGTMEGRDDDNLYGRGVKY